MDAKNLIASRIAQELKDGDVVNLGIELPTLIPNFLVDDIHSTMQSKNYFLGLKTIDRRALDQIWSLPMASPAAWCLVRRFSLALRRFLSFAAGMSMDSTVNGLQPAVRFGHPSIISVAQNIMLGDAEIGLSSVLKWCRPMFTYRLPCVAAPHGRYQDARHDGVGSD